MHLNDLITLGENISHLKMRKMSQQEFVDKISGGNAELYDTFMCSKVGYMTIKKISDNYGYLSPGQIESGWCFAFGEGLACRLEESPRWYTTSTIENIDWENKEFTTKNSTYKFTIEEYPYEELLMEIEKSNAIE